MSYTHQFKGGSSDADNDVITAVVNYANTTDAVVFRLICAANWTGSQWQEVPNTSSFRLAYTADSENQPEISVIAAGTEDVSKPDILVSGLENNIITFEGVPEGTKKFTVTSTSAFTLTPNVDWITLSETAGDADDAKTIVVTCKESTSSSLRKGQIDIKSGVSHYYITVVQSAAGGDLDPLISISDGNKKTISGKGEEFTVRVQANVDFQTEISDSWITAVPVVSTKAMVESKTLKFKAEANATGAARTATIRFYNGNIESVLTVDQDKFEPEVNITSYSGVTTISGFGETKKFTVQSNVPFTVTAPSWIKLPAAGVPEAGTYPISVQFEANTAAETRDGEIVFANADYGYEYKLNVSQAASGVYYFDDFMWIKPWADAYGSGDSVGENNASGKAPNIYTQPTQTGLLEKFAEIGYEMLNPEAKSAYSQKYYMKLGATRKHHGLKLPAIAAADGSDVTLSFDWSPHMTGSGNIDKVELVVEIEGDGQIVTAAGTAKISDVLVNDWEKGQLKWKNVSVKINGLKATDRISIRPTFLKDHDGITQQRWYIDNIRISK